MADRDQTRSRTAGRVEDARGRWVTLIDPFVMHKLCRYDTIPAEPLAKIAKELGSGWARIGVWIFSYGWSAAFLILIIAHFRIWGGGPSIPPREMRLWIILPSLFVVNCGLVWYFSRRDRLKRVHRILLQHLRCPHCGYDLRMLPTDSSDGATVCPECGCAWRLPHTSANPPDMVERGNG